MLHSTTQSRTSLPAAFVVGPLILLREKYPCNTKQVQRCTSTNSQRVKSAVTAVTGRTAFLGFIRRCQVKHVLPFYLDCFIEKYEFNIQNGVIYCLFMRENLLIIFIVQYHKDLLICFKFRF